MRYVVFRTPVDGIGLIVQEGEEPPLANCTQVEICETYEEASILASEMGGLPTNRLHVDAFDNSVSGVLLSYAVLSGAWEQSKTIKKLLPSKATTDAEKFAETFTDAINDARAQEALARATYVYMWAVFRAHVTHCAAVIYQKEPRRLLRRFEKQAKSADRGLLRSCVDYIGLLANPQIRPRRNA